MLRFFPSVYEPFSPFGAMLFDDRINTCITEFYAVFTQFMRNNFRRPPNFQAPLDKIQKLGVSPFRVFVRLSSPLFRSVLSNASCTCHCIFLAWFLRKSLISSILLKPRSSKSSNLASDMPQFFRVLLPTTACISRNLQWVLYLLSNLLFKINQINLNDYSTLFFSKSFGFCF